MMNIFSVKLSHNRVGNAPRNTESESRGPLGMRFNPAWILVAGFVLLPYGLSAQDLPLPVNSIERSEPVDFGTEIMPLLKKNCLACHHEKEAEGGLVLETIKQIRAGGDSGPGVVEKDVEASLIFTRASGLEEPLMPPEDNAVGAKPFSADELGLLKLWIEQGAPGSDTAPTKPIAFQPIPENLRTVYAIDTSPDGRSVAISRGNRMVVVDSATWQQTHQLVDESLGLGDVADVDLIQSVAFSPDGRRIATGGFRTVRIWRQTSPPFDPMSSPLATSAGPVAISPEATTAALVNAIGDIEVWNLADNTQLRSMSGHADRIVRLAITSVADSPQSQLTQRRLISMDQSGRLICWDLETGEPISALETELNLNGWAVSQDGTTVVGIDQQRIVHMFQLNAEAKWSIGKNPADGVTDATAVALTNQPVPMLVLATESAGVTIRALSDQQVIRTIDHGAIVDTLAISEDQSKLITGGRDGATKIWNIVDGTPVATMQGDVQINLQVARSERDTTRQKATIDRLNQQAKSLQERLKKEEEALTKVNAEQQKAMETLASQEKTRLDAVTAMNTTQATIAKAEEDAKAAQAAIEAAQQAMAAAVAAKEAATKELEAKKKAIADAEAKKKATETTIENRKQTIAAAEAAKQLAVAAIPKHQLIVARATKEMEWMTRRDQQTRQLLSAPSEDVLAAAFSGDGKRVATTHRSGEVRIYRATDGVPLAKFAGKVAPDRPGVAFVNDWVIGYGVAQSASVWSPAIAWQLERTIGDMQDPQVIIDRVTALDFRRDGHSIAVGSGEPSRSGHVKIFAVETGRMVRDFGPIHSDTVLGLRFSPDGRSLVSSAADKTIRLLDISSGQSVRSMEGHTHHVLGVAWQNDGRTIASAGADQTVKLWNTETGQQIRTIAGFGKEVTAVSFVQSSNQIVSAAAKGQVRLSNAADGKTIRNFDAKGDFLYCAAVTRDGKRVLAGGHSGTVWVWEIADGKLVAELK